MLEDKKVRVLSGLEKWKGGVCWCGRVVGSGGGKVEVEDEAQSVDQVGVVLDERREEEESFGYGSRRRSRRESKRHAGHRLERHMKLDFTNEDQKLATCSLILNSKVFLCLF